MTNDKAKTAYIIQFKGSKLQVEYSFVLSTRSFDAIGTAWTDKTLNVDILKKENTESVCSFVVNCDTSILSELEELMNQIQAVINYNESS